MNTRTFKQMLLVLAASLVPMSGLLVVSDRTAAGTPAETCGPQQIHVTPAGVRVDPGGCEVQLVVWSYADDAVKQCIPDTEACIWLPQNREGSVTGTGPLTLPLPCGGWQADVFDNHGWQADVFDNGLELPEVLTQDWLDAHPEFWFNLLAGAHGERICEPEPEPVEPPVVEPNVIERPAATPPAPAAPVVEAAAAAPVRTAAVRFAG